MASGQSVASILLTVGHVRVPPQPVSPRTPTADDLARATQVNPT